MSSVTLSCESWVYLIFFWKADLVILLFVTLSDCRVDHTVPEVLEAVCGFVAMTIT